MVGIVSAAASGFAAIWWMLRYLQTHNYDIFVVYRLVVAAAHPAADRDRSAAGHV